MYPLVPPDLPKIARDGEVRRISRGPRTVDEVLSAARAAMLEEDRAEELARDPIAYVRAHRPRRLIDKLLGRI